MVGLFQPKPFYDSIKNSYPNGILGCREEGSQDSLVLWNEKSRSANKTLNSAMMDTIWYAREKCLVFWEFIVRSQLLKLD